MTDIDIHARAMQALAAASLASTPAGRRPFGWIRLARVASMTGADTDPYVLAVRPLTTAREFQLGCSCPDWIYRQRKSGGLCKHQIAFLSYQGDTSDARAGFWLYRAGKAYLQKFQGR